MIPALLVLTLTSNQTPVVASFDGEDAGIRVVEKGGALHAEFLVYERSKGFVVAAVSSTYPAADSNQGLTFSQANITESGVVLTGKTFTATIDVPKKGGVFSVAVSAKAEKDSLKSAMFGVALTPLEQPTKATHTFAPTTGLVTQDRFATPLALASGGGYGIALMPDVQDLATNRPMSPVLTLENDGRTSPGAIIAFGFLPYDRDENWTPKMADRNLDNPEEFSWKFDLLVTTEPNTAIEANRHLWNRDGAERFLSPLPQTVPFRYYTKPTYDIGSAVDQPGSWWVSPNEDAAMRAPLGADGQAKLTAGANLARFAYGMKWWAVELQQVPWADNADEVMNLIVSAPQRSKMTPVAFDTATSSWRFEPFDVGATAVTARFKLKFAESSTYMGAEKLSKQVVQAARELMGTSPNGTSALFLLEFSKSNVISDKAAKSDAADYLEDSRASLVALAGLYARQGTAPSVETVSTALYMARTGGHAAASRLVDQLFLWQALWQPTTVKGTEVFGAFVGEHFSEESQSEYSADLLDTVLTLGRREYGDRAIAALRAPLGLFAHGTHGISGMYFPSFIKAFRSSPWFGLNGQAEFGQWRGVAEGVGQTLTSLAQVTDKFGSLYTHKDGWTIGIDGITIVDGVTYSAFSRNPLAFEGVFPYEHVDASTDGRTNLSDPLHFPAMRSIALVKRDEGLYVVALPGFTVIDARNRLSGSFILHDGTALKAEFLPTGLGAMVTTENLAGGPVSFRGLLDKTVLSVRPTSLLASPPAADLTWPMGWRRMKGLSDIVRISVSVDGKPVVSTADNGRGARDAALTGVIESQLFLVTENGIKFTLIGSSDHATYVELIDPKSGVVLASAHKQGDGPEEVTWETYEMVGQSVVFRLVDESKTGSIEVKDLRTVKIGPD